MPQESVVDMQGLFHTCHSTIYVWQNKPYPVGAAVSEDSKVYLEEEAMETGFFGTWLAVKKRGAFSDKEAREVESCGELQDVLRHQVDTGTPGVGDVLLNFNWYRPVEES